MKYFRSHFSTSCIVSRRIRAHDFDIEGGDLKSKIFLTLKFAVLTDEFQKVHVILDGTYRWRVKDWAVV